jgi:hypothetical protein
MIASRTIDDGYVKQQHHRGQAHDRERATLARLGRWNVGDGVHWLRGSFQVGPRSAARGRRIRHDSGSDAGALGSAAELGESCARQEFEQVR